MCAVSPHALDPRILWAATWGSRHSLLIVVSGIGGHASPDMTRLCTRKPGWRDWCYVTRQPRLGNGAPLGLFEAVIVPGGTFSSRAYLSE